MFVSHVVENGLAEFVVDHPPLNILTRAVMGELRQALRAVGADPTVRVLLLRTAGRHFSVGAAVDEHLPPQDRVLIAEFVDTVRALLDCPVPVVAAVQGRCLGGAFELVLGADLIVAGEGSSFGLPEIQLGVFPPVACALLAARTGRALAARAILSGESVDAESARAHGLIAEVVPDGELVAAARGLAASMTRHSAVALRAAKRALNATPRGWEAGVERASSIYLDELMASADAVEGLRAFLEKRTPEWSHR
jgi:cyclohexa-1,5-dienecarbonyl-CoA hydratase